MFQLHLIHLEFLSILGKSKSERSRCLFIVSKMYHNINLLYFFNIPKLALFTKFNEFKVNYLGNFLLVQNLDLHIR